jgi:hypothetical protein
MSHSTQAAAALEALVPEEEEWAVARQWVAAAHSLRNHARHFAQEKEQGVPREGMGAASLLLLGQVGLRAAGALSRLKRVI